MRAERCSYGLSSVWMTFLEFISGICQGMGSGWSWSRTRQGGAAPGGGQALMRSRPASQDESPGAAGESFAGQHWVRQPNMGSGRPRSLSVSGAPGGGGVHLAGDVTLEAADDLFLGQALFAAPGDVGAGGRVGAHPGGPDPAPGGAGPAA